MEDPNIPNINDIDVAFAEKATWICLNFPSTPQDRPGDPDFFGLNQ